MDEGESRATANMRGVRMQKYGRERRELVA